MKILRLNCGGLFPACATATYCGMSNGTPGWVLFHGDPPHGNRAHWQFRARVHRTMVRAEKPGQLLGITCYDFDAELAKHLSEEIDKPKVHLVVSPRSEWDYLILHDPNTPVGGRTMFRTEGDVKEIVRATTAYGLEPNEHVYPLPVWFVRGRAAIEWERVGGLFGDGGVRRARVEFDGVHTPRFHVEV